MALSEEQKKEIKEQQNQQNVTKRVISPELEKILYEALPVLDHGFQEKGAQNQTHHIHAQQYFTI